MATFEQLETALRNADKAGDANAAKIFAAEILKMREQPSSIMDVAKQIPSGIARGMAGMAAAPAQIGNWLGEKATLGIDSALGLDHQQAPDDSSPLNPAKLPGAVESMGLPQPETTAGEYANTIGQFLPSAVIGGPVGFGKKLLTAAVSGASSEAGGQLTEGTAAEPYVRFGASFAGPAAISGVKRAVTPFPLSAERAKAVQTMKKEGVGLTAGQTTGSETLRYAESELGGRAVSRQMEKQGEQFTSAALKRTGTTANRASPEVIDQAFTRIGNQFDSLAARNNFVPDRQLANDVLIAVNEYSSMVPSSARAPIVGKVAQDILTSARNGMSGEQYQALSSRLASMSRNTTDPQLKHALMGLRESIDDTMERGLAASGSPDLGAWKQVRNEYRNLLVIEHAAAGAGEKAAEGILSPSALRNATVQKHGKRNYTRGKGDFADLARAGEATMKPLPQSGTAPRSAVRNFGAALPTILGASAGSPLGPVGAIMGGAAGFAAPYAMGRALMSSPMQSYLTNQLLAQFGSLSPGQRAMIPAFGAGTSISNPVNY